MYDIAIIGLGPSGATLARLLSKDFKIVALDKSTGESNGFIKPCGGLLAPAAQKVLAEFNLVVPKSVLADPQIFSVKTIDIKTKLTKHYQRFYINLDRFKFDNWLRSLIPSYVEILYGTKCVKIERLIDKFRLTAVKGGQKTVLEARYIVGADGANSIVRRSFYPEFKIKKYLVIQQYFKDCHLAPFYSCIFDSSLTNSYAWGLSKDTHFILGGAFKIKNAKTNFEKLKQEAKPFGFKLESPLKTEACLILKPNSFNFCYGKDGVFLIGEAAGFISPSSFEGISFALKTGYLLSKVLNERPKNPNKAYKRATFKLRLKIFIKSFKAVILFSPILRKLVMKSKIKSIPII